MDIPKAHSPYVAIEGVTAMIPVNPDLNAKQAGNLYRAFTPMEKTRLIEKFSGDLRQVNNEQICLLLAAYCYQADPDYGTRVAEAVSVDLQRIRQIANNLNE
jgi:catalase